MSRLLPGLRAISPRLLELNIRENALGEQGAELFAEALAAMGRLRTLRADANSLGITAMGTIALALGHCGQLQSLNLANNLAFGTSSADWARVLEPALRRLAGLRCVELYGNDLGAHEEEAEGLKTVLAALSQHPRLRTLNIRASKLGCATVRRCSRGSGLTAELRRPDGPGSAVLARALQGELGGRLAHLDLCSKLRPARSGVGAQLLTPVAAGNRLGPEDMTLLAPGLLACVNLEVLLLESNSLTPAALLELAAACTPRLQRLDLTNNRHIGTDGGESLARLCAGLADLRVLGCKSTGLTSGAAAQLAGWMIAGAASLEQLDLSSNPIGDEGTGNLAAALATCFGLTDLSLASCGISAAALPRLVAALPRAVRSLELGNNVPLEWTGSGMAPADPSEPNRFVAALTVLAGQDLVSLGLANNGIAEVVLLALAQSLGAEVS